MLLHVSEAMTLFLRSYMSDHCHDVKFGDALSGTHPITSGVPQGSILGPMLYNIYAADMPTAFTTGSHYVDDTAILCRSLRSHLLIDRLQLVMNAVHGWFSIWRIFASSGKSAVVLFHRKTKPPPFVVSG